jgi:hypothetical protein
VDLLHFFVVGRLACVRVDSIRIAGLTFPILREFHVADVTYQYPLFGPLDTEVIVTPPLAASTRNVNGSGCRRKVGTQP